MATSTTRTLVELVSRSCCKTKKLFLFGNEIRKNLLVHSFNYNLQNKALISVSQRNRRKMADEKPVETAIRTKLTDALKPLHLDVINESYMHNVPKGTESHFKVVIVSSAFEDVKRLQKHKLVHSALQEELDAGLHALSIVAKTPAEWDKSQEVGQSPACRGGAGL